MKKKTLIIIISIAIVLIAIGVLSWLLFFKKNDKKLVCTYKDSEYEENVIIYFKNGKEYKKKISTKMIFESENSAKEFYEMEKNSQIYNYEIVGNNVLLNYEEDVIQEYALTYEERKKISGDVCK